MDKTTGSVATTDKHIGTAAQSTLVYDKLASTLISEKTQANYARTQRGSEAVSSAVSDAAQAVTNGVVVSLSSAWLGISAALPARTEGARKLFEKVAPSIDPNTLNQEHYSPTVKRFDRKYLYSLRLGEYFMPLSQTFSLRAKKRLNVCSLVDGIDIIQQTRHEAKTIDCSLRLTLRTNQPNLEIIANSQRGNVDAYVQDDEETTKLVRSLETFGKFLSELYDKDAVFAIDNKVINEVFNVEYAIISEYNFRPQVSRSTFQFDFTLTEVKVTDDILTEDATQIKSADGTNV